MFRGLFLCSIGELGNPGLFPSLSIIIISLHITNKLTMTFCLSTSTNRYREVLLRGNNSNGTLSEKQAARIAKGEDPEVVMQEGAQKAKNDADREIVDKVFASIRQGEGETQKREAQTGLTGEDTQGVTTPEFKAQNVYAGTPYDDGVHSIGSRGRATGSSSVASAYSNSDSTIRGEVNSSSSPSSSSVLNQTNQTANSKNRSNVWFDSDSERDRGSPLTDMSVKSSSPSFSASIGEGSFRMHVGKSLDGDKKVSRTGRVHDLVPGGDYVDPNTIEDTAGVSQEYLLGATTNVRRSTDDKGRMWEVERLKYGQRQQHTSITVTHSPPRSPVKDQEFDRNSSLSPRGRSNVNIGGAVDTTGTRTRVQAPYTGWGDSQGRMPQQRTLSDSRSPNRDPRKANRNRDGVYSGQKANLQFNSGSGNDSYGHRIQRSDNSNRGNSKSRSRSPIRPNRAAGNAYAQANPTTRFSSSSDKFDNTNSMYSGLDLSKSNQDYTKRTSNANAQESSTLRRAESGSADITPSQGRSGPLDGGSVEVDASPPRSRYSTPRTSVKPSGEEEAKRTSTAGGTQLDFHTTWKEGKKPNVKVRGGDPYADEEDEKEANATQLGYDAQSSPFSPESETRYMTGSPPGNIEEPSNNGSGPITSRTYRSQMTPPPSASAKANTKLNQGNQANQGINSHSKPGRSGGPSSAGPVVLSYSAPSLRGAVGDLLEQTRLRKAEAIVKWMQSSAMGVLPGDVRMLNRQTAGSFRPSAYEILCSMKDGVLLCRLVARLLRTPETSLRGVTWQPSAPAHRRMNIACALRTLQESTHPGLHKVPRSALSETVGAEIQEGRVDSIVGLLWEIKAAYARAL